MHEASTRFGQTCLLARLRRQGVKLGESVAQIVFVGAGAGELLGRRRARGGHRSPFPPCRALRRALALIAAEGVEQLAMRRLVEQPVLLELALDLDQYVTDLA